MIALKISKRSFKRHASVLEPSAVVGLVGMGLALIRRGRFGKGSIS